MGLVLSGNVALRNPDDQHLVVLVAGQRVPGWAKELVGGHLLIEETKPKAKPKAKAGPVSPPPPPPVAEGSPPPRDGEGSGRDAWAVYAEGHGFEVEAGDGRDEIIAALDEAGIPTDPPADGAE